MRPSKPRASYPGAATLLVFLLAGCGEAGPTTPSEEQVGDVGITQPARVQLPISAAVSGQTTTTNPDGTVTVRQTINAASTPPHYVTPSHGGGFGIYSWFNQDYGWMHEFADWNTSGLTITSAKLIITAFDVDSEPFHGADGEYDAVSVDGTQLDPGYLQGSNGATSVTTFDVPLGAIVDDGNINVWLNIDMFHTSDFWATQVNRSELEITYRLGPPNDPPFQPTLSLSPVGAPGNDANLSVAVTGPSPADPDGDAVTYEYRWFLNTGTGGFLDPAFHGRGTFTGNTVPASATQPGDLWRVQVTPRDEHGAIGPFAVATYPAVTADGTAPVITAAIAGTLGNNGWYTGDVDVSWTVTDAESGITSETGCETVTVSVDTDGQTFTCTATSAGGTASESVTIKRDATAPAVSGSATGTEGNNGWFTDDVSVSFVVTDATSGVGPSSGCDAVTVTEDTTGQDFLCSAEDNAGNVNSALVSVKRDATDPTITPDIGGTEGDNGWYTSDVVVSFLRGDATSGEASAYNCTDSTVDADTNGLDFTCTVTDAAGNEASLTVTIQRDATMPEVSVDVAGTLGDNGWYTSDVGVTFAHSDATSGVATTTGCDAVSITADTDDVTYTCVVTDAAGNEGSAAATVKRDATDPVVTFTGNAGSYAVDEDVSITCSASDNLSGIASDTCADVTGPAYTFPLGTNTFAADATDKAGNEGSASGSFSVSVDPGSLCALTELWVNNAGVADSMCEKLRAAAASELRGNQRSFTGQMEAYVNHVQAQSGKSVSTDHAAILMALAQSML